MTLSRRDMLRATVTTSIAGGCAGLLPQAKVAAQGQRDGGGQRRQPPVSITRDNPAIVYSRRRCEECGDCRTFCRETMTVSDWKSDLTTTPCIHCGQCIHACPEGAIAERSDVARVEAALADKTKIVVAATAPAVRVALAEMLGGRAGDVVTETMVSALKKLGFAYVIDTTFAADVTVMEEAAELRSRLQDTKKTPLWTSCCPAWVRFAELFFPSITPQIATTKSPLLLQGTLIKTYFAAKRSIDPKQLVVVAIAPCTAKKAEILRTGSSVDIVLTTRELGGWLRTRRVDTKSLTPAAFDTPMGTGSGGGVIFGATGGVTESLLRTAYWQVTGTEPPADFLSLNDVRGTLPMREASVTLGDRAVRVAVVHGTGTARALLESGNAARYDLIEVMACPGGCSGGGGQPRAKSPAAATTARLAGLYASDKAATIRASHNNPEIQALYRDFLEKPLSDKAKSLLHNATSSNSNKRSGP